MKAIKISILLFLILLIGSVGTCQVAQKTGYIYTEIASIISDMPSDAGEDYQSPEESIMEVWEIILHDLMDGSYEAAAINAHNIGYELIEFRDTFATPLTYYILQTQGENYWGTYVYNPTYCRPLVIQSPHAKKDANTGHQGIHVFRKTEAMFFQVNGTNRCNSSAYSSCTGTTTGCSGDGSSEAYRVSDMAHTAQSFFQRFTEVVFERAEDSYFIQLHGFTKSDTDPYVILSNGAQAVPEEDFLSAFRDNLFLEDEVLTFKVAHIDLEWTRLRGFWNTQGRHINGSEDPCTVGAIENSGRFFHVEQERERLRSDVTGWNKIANALNNTFECDFVSAQTDVKRQEINIFPNPSSGQVTFDLGEDEVVQVEVYDIGGRLVQCDVPVRQSISMEGLRSGYYILNILTRSGEWFVEGVVKI